MCLLLSLRQLDISIFGLNPYYSHRWCLQMHLKSRIKRAPLHNKTKLNSEIGKCKFDKLCLLAEDRAFKLLFSSRRVFRSFEECPTKELPLVQATGCHSKRLWYLWCRLSTELAFEPSFVFTMLSHQDREFSKRTFMWDFVRKNECTHPKFLKLVVFL